MQFDLVREPLKRASDEAGCAIRVTARAAPADLLRGRAEAVDALGARFRSIGMEQVWNRGGATGGKGSPRSTPKNRLN
jgi:hypothetical protein